MSPHEVWFLLALALIMGGGLGRFISWRRYRRQLEDEHDHGYDCGWDDAMRRVDSDRWLAEQAADEIAPQRHTWVLEPGPTIYPELAALAEQALDGPQIDADRPDTGTWMRTLRIRWESEYPIPGTPQWEARHPVGVS